MHIPESSTVRPVATGKIPKWRVKPAVSRFGIFPVATGRSLLNSGIAYYHFSLFFIIIYKGIGES
jgi:hypothetical protein